MILQFPERQSQVEAERRWRKDMVTLFNGSWFHYCKPNHGWMCLPTAARDCPYCDKTPPDAA